MASTAPAYPERFGLAGTRAVVTGGASGIGYESARALAQCGARPILLDRDSAALERAQQTLRNEGIDAATYRIDVTDADAVRRIADDIVEREGRIDTLVNSAGIARLNSVFETPDDEWRQVMDINVNGTFWVSRAFGRHMVAQRAGSIVNLGSMSGVIVNRPQSAASYMTSKGAVHMLTKALATEWAKDHVRVNALAPGYIGTEMTLAMRARPELFDVWMDMTPMGRCGEPAEIASAVVFLASSASSYMTGSIVPIDGGYTSW
ncbi:SDR family NAD(P)-dependent oxidoreductase [Paraburkholderia sp. SOS3]|uniref:SDR family NAD(P)-dependent oxidoreductase n=1 Tax=Paraburkholderia sp. SOS3 TaxID=1926494 RepID=UPI0009477147|nr:SDR family oxidoreductase [Paraburkholderia sp. SOS3]APR35340.1 3-oxoacyl-ACP reductase [Paraburkholderia sp. SOS3]